MARKPALSSQDSVRGLIITIDHDSPIPHEMISDLKPSYVSYICAGDETLGFAAHVSERSKQAGHALIPHYEKCDISRFESILDAHNKTIHWMEGMGIKPLEVGIAIGTSSVLCTVVGAFFAVYQNGLTCYVPSDKGSLKLVEPQQLMNVLKIQDAVQRFNMHDYSGAKQVFEQLSTPPTLVARTLIKALLYLCEGYKSWDLFRYWESMAYIENALESLNECSHEFAELKEITEQLGKNLDFLQNMKDCTKHWSHMCRTSHVIVDLLSNAKRRRAQGLNNDALVRLYRVLEAASQHRLQVRYGIDPSNFAHTVANMKDTKSLVPLFCEALGLAPDHVSSTMLPKQTSGFMQNIKILCVLKDAYSSVFMQEKGHVVEISETVGNLVQARDKNILVHDYVTADDMTVAHYHAGVEEIVRRLLDIEEEESHPEPSEVGSQDSYFDRLDSGSTYASVVDRTIFAVLFRQPA